jgi:hypothetical protein
LRLFESGLVVIVGEGDRSYGLVTRIDALNYLRRKLRCGSPQPDHR